MAAQLAHGDLLLEPDIAVASVEQRAAIMQDFARARQHIALRLRLKLSLCRRLPLLLFGLGHLDPSVDRSCRHRAVALWA